MHRIEDLALRCLGILLEQRRQLPDNCGGAWCEACIEPHFHKVMQCIYNEEPLRLMLLAFPCKSPSPAKVLGHLPDMAEMLSFQFLSNIPQANWRSIRTGC